MVKDNVLLIEQVIEKSLAQSIEKQHVEPIVVTKMQSQEAIQAIYDAGMRHFAENRVDQLLMRQQQFPQEDIVWHLIGTLQSRKVKEIVDRVAYIHSLDRLSVVKQLDKRVTAPVKCFLQVNVSGEENKHGLKPQLDDIKAFLTEAAAYPNVQIIGLMTMAPYEASEEELRAYFKHLHRLRDQLVQETEFTSCQELSMGMSNDYSLAIQEGATFVRIGSAYFKEK